MEIRTSRISSRGEKLEIVHRDIESEADFAGKKIKGCRAYSFCKDKFVIVYAPSKDFWTPPGGSVEEGETVRDAVSREVKEEANMRVLKQRFIGLVEVAGPHEIEFFTTSACLVEPIGDFVSDPDGDISKIKLIDISEYKPYSEVRNEGMSEVADRLIKRAVEAKAQMETEEKLKNKLREEGFAHVFEWTDLLNTKYAEHAHKGKVSFYITRGSVTFRSGIDKTIRAGERFDVPVGLKHTAMVGPEGCDWVVGEEIEGDA